MDTKSEQIVSIWFLGCTIFFGSLAVTTSPRLVALYLIPACGFALLSGFAGYMSRLTTK